MNKKHLTRFAAMATIALMGSTAAWADADASGMGWSLSNGTLTLNSNSEYEYDRIVISSGEASTINGFGNLGKIVVDRGSLGTTQFSTVMLPVDVVLEGNSYVDAAYLPMDYNKSENTLTFSSAVSVLEANKPYIIKVNSSLIGTKPLEFSVKSGSSVQSTAVSGEKPYTTEVSGSCFSITGTYVTKRWDSGDNLSNDYGFSADGTDQGKFVRIQNNPNSSESVTLLPARAYLTCTKAQAVKGLGKVASEESLPDVINVRFVDNEGGTLSIGTMNTKTGEIQMQDRYYDLKGRKLNAKPQNKIMYVNKKAIKH